MKNKELAILFGLLLAGVLLAEEAEKAASEAETPLPKEPIIEIMRSEEGLNAAAPPKSGHIVIDPGKEEVSALPASAEGPVQSGAPKAESQKSRRPSLEEALQSWRGRCLGSTTQCFWRGQAEILAPGLTDSVKGPFALAFLDDSFLRLDLEGENAYRATYSNGVLSVSFPGTELTDKRSMREQEYPWDDLVGLPLEGTLTNYYHGVFLDGDCWRFDFIMLPEAQLAIRHGKKDLSYLSIRRHVWYDEKQNRIVKTYRRTVGGEEITLDFSGK